MTCITSINLTSKKYCVFNIREIAKRTMFTTHSIANKATTFSTSSQAIFDKIK